MFIIINSDQSIKVELHLIHNALYFTVTYIFRKNNNL